MAMLTSYFKVATDVAMAVTAALLQGWVGSKICVQVQRGPGPGQSGSIEVQVQGGLGPERSRSRSREVQVA